LTLGSNIGTTVTGLLAAFSVSSRSLSVALQIALCHTIFNVAGILIWYPIPFIRRIPINLAIKLGYISAEYCWFPVLYLILCFALIPLVVFALSFAGM
jgi:solute carrier family 34 (sodium-dependent phosphate cotransporter)